MDEVIGRKKEIDILKSKYNYNKAELIVLFGKKGVGKTFLVRTIFPDMFFHATALYNGDAKNLVNFSKELNDGNIYTDWSSAFFALKDKIIASPLKRKVIFIDEFPFYSRNNKDFISAFSYFLE